MLSAEVNKVVHNTVALLIIFVERFFMLDGFLIPYGAEHKSSSFSYFRISHNASAVSCLQSHRN